MRLPQQQHLPKDRPASEVEGWGFTLWEFLSENWIYLLGILIVLIIFFWARISWKRRQEKSKLNGNGL